MLFIVLVEMLVVSSFMVLALNKLENDIEWLLFVLGAMAFLYSSVALIVV
jgi:hypothetical protein